MLKTLKSIDYHKEQIHLLLSAKGGIIASNLITPLLTILILKDFVPLYILLILTSAQMVIFTVRMIFTKNMLQILDTADKETINRKLKQYLYMIFLNSFLLGVIAIYAVIYADDIYILFLFVIYIAVSAGSLATLGVVYHAVFIFTFVVLSIFALALIFIGGESRYYLTAALVFTYIFIVMNSAFKIYSSMSNNIKQKDELEKKNKQIIQQSRLAQMGEMINMIAHQWRQPLTAISATANNLTFKMMMDDMNKDEFEKEIGLIADYSQHLSKTIDDFRGFFKDDKEKEVISLDEIVKSTLEIVKISLKSKDIKLVTNLNSKEEFEIYSSELKQVLLNIIKNAEDAILEKRKENSQITIETKNKTLIIIDNAGGIPEDIIDKIFDPYFSTKKEKDGTGLGLYMSKTIITEHCGGELRASNYKDGAMFKIQLS